MPETLESELKKRGDFASPQQAVVVGLLRTNDVFQFEFGRLFRKYGLTQAQYNVLTILRGEGEPMPVLEIRARLVARTAAISTLLTKLENKKLIRRSHCKDDRRVWYTSLTEAGLRLVNEMDEEVMAMHSELCGGLTEKECRQLSKLLQKARAAVA